MKDKYGKLEGGKWIREVSMKKHYWRAYKGFGFHLRFRALFSDPSVDGCQVKDLDTGRVWFIASSKWLEAAIYVKDRLQYAVPLEAFSLVDTGLKKTRVERYARKKDRRTDKGNA